MNCFSRCHIGAPALALLALVLNLEASPSAADELDSSLQYLIEYVITPDRGMQGAWVEVKLGQQRRLLRELDMKAPSERISRVEGDGEFKLETGRLVWHPPENGGHLRWFALINNRRGRAYDAHIDSDWAMFRAEDVIPAARTRTLKGSSSKTSMRFILPDGWNSVTQYSGNNDEYSISNPERRFDSPTGWIALGVLGVRLETIAGVRVKIAGPVEHGVRRMDMLALLQWNLPELTRVLPSFPERLTVVSAGDPMWRGGLSAPMSVFLHADRPLLSENATSTLLHESVHVGLGKRAAAGADWIVEGLAEYYSLQALRRSGTISEKRFLSSMRMQKQWGEKATSLCNGNSSGANTAFAVTLLAQLDRRIQDETDGQKSLDDVTGALAKSNGPITIQTLQQAVDKSMGSIPSLITEKNLPGCGPD